MAAGSLTRMQQAIIGPAFHGGFADMEQAGDFFGR
jgi:hypothetical protein